MAGLQPLQLGHGPTLRQAPVGGHRPGVHDHSGSKAALSNAALCLSSSTLRFSGWWLVNRMGFRNVGGSTDAHDRVTRVGGAWWWPAFFGVVSIVAGVLALAWPGPTLLVLAVLFGIELIVWGIYRLVGAVTFGDAGGGARTLWAILGVLSLLLGFYALRHIVITLLSLGLLLGIFWLVDGIGLIVSAVEHRGMPGRGLSLLSGVLGVIAGLVLLVWPSISLLTLAWLAGLWLLIVGVMQVSVAIQLRRH